ncbi:MAG: tetratricopeptide repeat protein [Bacteroidales bacterium]|nr:tetratricopeptide repeat protein [Bacteroidales bacterium]
MLSKINLNLLFILLSVCAIANAQSLDQARKFYNEGNFEAAKPVFEKYIKISPKDPSYNHWYGVCLYETGNIGEAEKYIKFAASRKVQEAYRYLGELYFKTYRFDEAAEAYNSYIKLLTKKKANTEAFEEKLDLAEKANRMLENTEDIQIIDSIIVDKDSFLSAYKLSPESGEIQYFEDFFESDEIIEDIVYLNQRGDKAFYSNKNGDKGYDIFTLNKNLDGWADEQQLSGSVNSNFNEKYPFVMPDGVTLYFASDKDGSLGGYDLYVTRYNNNNNTYLNPEQLGMPFNSPYNDYLMVIDEVKGVGWFASDRFQEDGKVVIYTFIPNDSKVTVESEDPEYKRKRAMISSIEDSWKAQSDYNELRKKARTAAVRIEKKKDFTFVVNDQIIYHTISEFKDEGARNLFTKQQQAKESLSSLSKQLLKAREAYSKGNTSQKAHLKESILQMEENQEQLISEVHKLEIQARNAEIKSLQKK